MRISRSCLIVHATGGEVANHLCMRESWIDPIVNIVEVLGVCSLGGFGIAVPNQGDEDANRDAQRLR